MSLRQIQTRNFLEFIISSYLSSGKKPSDNETSRALNFYFSQQPAGSPIKLDPNIFRANPVSDVEDINDFMASVQINLDNLFQQIDEHLDQSTLLTTALLSQMKSIRADRKKLSDKIDDILLGIYNTDGFFYSISDDFFDSDLIDFSFTSAFLDIESGVVMLPTNADRTKAMSLYGLNRPDVQVFERYDGSKAVPFSIETPFDEAVDGLSNTAWYMKITRPEPSNGVTARVSLDVYGDSLVHQITQLAIHPHGVIPVQCSVQKLVDNDGQTSNLRPFSNYIKKSSEKMVFINENSSEPISRLVFEFTKEQPDYYEDNIDGTRSGIYIIGIKELLMTQQSFVSNASLVSNPLSIPEALSEDQAIDSVSLTVEHDVPPNARVSYFVAPDVPGAQNLSDFNWKEIEPLSKQMGSTSKTIVNLNGANTETVFIRSVSRDGSDIPIINLNKYTSDPNAKNPTYSLSQEFPVYRIASFGEDFFSGTLSLEEGINTTKVLHTTLSDQNIEDTFEFWKTKFETPGSYVSTYGETDIGNGFFYGADVGENERSVYIETNVYADIDYPVTLKEISKTNPNSKLWSVKAFLNGREIADMPVGIHKVTAPMKLNKGKNNIVFAINIPRASSSSYVPYIGSLDFDMSEFGGFKLGELIYVDLFKFKDNGYRDDANISPNKWFTLYNGEIITRSNITNNYRLRYSTPTGLGPSAIRLRADLSRFDQDDRASPMIDSYRIRFGYGNEEQS